MSGGDAELGARERARTLGLSLGVPPATFAGREAAAEPVLAALVVMAFQPSHSQRRALANEILTNAAQLLPMSNPGNARFHAALRGAVITIQEMPSWYNHVRISNAELVRRYVMTKKAVLILGLATGGSALNPLGSSMKHAVKGVVERGGRSAVAGALGSVATGTTSAATGGFKGRLGGVWVLLSGALLYSEASRRLYETELQRRAVDGSLTDAQYREAFGADAPLPRAFPRGAR